MKKLITSIIIAAIISLPLITFASEPGEPPEEPGGDPIGPGGGAPIGSGTFILIALGAAYGSKKVYDINKKELED